MENVTWAHSHEKYSKVQILSEIQFKLSETEVCQGNLSGAISLVTEGFGIEKSQYIVHRIDWHQGIYLNDRMLLKAYIKFLRKTYSVAEKNQVLDQQCRLETRIDSYEHKMSLTMRLDDDTWWAKECGWLLDKGETPVEMSGNPPELYPDRWFTHERDQITLPSALALGEIEWLSLRQIATIEFKLWKGQVTDALDGLQLALGEKSLCFCTEVWNANTQWTMSHMWDNIHKLDTEAWKHRSIYPHAQSALQ